MKEYTPDYVERCQLDHYCKLVLTTCGKCSDTVTGEHP